MVKEEILKTFRTFQGGMYIRTLTPDKQVHGYFSEEEALEKSLDTMPEDTTLYFNAQIISDVAISKFPLNEFSVVGKGAGLKNEDIEKVRYVLLDVDVASQNEESEDANKKRNATPAENVSALSFVGNLSNNLTGEGFTGMGIVNSGNGSYLIIPFEAKEFSNSLEANIKYFVSLLTKEYKDSVCHLDSKVLNPARIFKMPGTISKKGVPSEDNPWRHAKNIVDADFNKPNDWNTLVMYIANHEVQNNFVSVSSDGKTFWDMDVVCSEVENYFEAYRDQYDRMYVETVYNDDNCCYLLEKENTRTVLREWLRTCTGKKYVPNSVVDAALVTLTDIARSGKAVELHHRMKKSKDEVLYALGPNKSAVRIIPNHVSMIEYPKKTFLFEDGDEVQVEPDLTVEPKEVRGLMKQVFHIQEERDWILLLTFVGVSLFSSAASPIAFIEGEKGSSKSSSCKWMQRLISPKRADLYSFPKTEKDLGILLSKECFLSFDNLSGIRNDVADLLCQAVTGGYVKTRKLFTDDEVVVRNLKTILVLNGIAFLSQREDLVDRVLLIRLKRVHDAVRITDDELKKRFEALRPKILGGYFNAVAEAMAMDDIECIHTKIRTLDYEVNAIKIGMALGYTQEEIESAFKENKNTLIQDMIKENPLTNLLITLLQDKKSISRTATELYDALHKMYADKKNIILPNSASAVSRKLNQVRSDLEALGITFELDRSNGKKQIFYNDGTYVPNSYKESKTDKLTTKEREEKLKKLAEPDED